MIKELFKDTPEDKKRWILRKKDGFGGTDVPACLGISPYKTPLKVIMDKNDKDFIQEMNNKMYMGIILEDTVAKLFETNTGKKVHKENSMIWHDTLPFYANIDRKVSNEDAILECKTTSAFMKSEWEEEKIPEHYIMQCMWYLYITGYETCYIACLIGGQDFVWRTIKRDEEMIKVMVEQMTDFANKYFKTGILPPPTIGDEDIITQRYEPSPDSIELGDYEDIIEERVNLKKMLDDNKKEMAPFEKRIKEIDVYLKDIMEGKEVGYCKQYTITNKITHRNLFDSTRFKKEQPDVYKEYQKDSISHAISVKEF